MHMKEMNRRRRRRRIGGGGGGEGWREEGEGRVREGERGECGDIRQSLLEHLWAQLLCAE